MAVHGQPCPWWAKMCCNWSQTAGHWFRAESWLLGPIQKNLLEALCTPSPTSQISQSHNYPLIQKDLFLSQIQCPSNSYYWRKIQKDILQTETVSMWWWNNWIDSISRLKHMLCSTVLSILDHARNYNCNFVLNTLVIPMYFGSKWSHLFQSKKHNILLLAERAKKL